MTLNLCINNTITKVVDQISVREMTNRGLKSLSEGDNERRGVLFFDDWTGLFVVILEITA